MENNGYYSLLCTFPMIYQQVITIICLPILFSFFFFYKESERLTCLSQTAGNLLVTAIADMGNVQQERNAISKFLDDSDIKNLLQDARQSMEILEQHARWLNEDRFVMYVWSITIYLYLINARNTVITDNTYIIYFS